MIVRGEVAQDRYAIHDLISAAFDRSAEADLVDRLRADGDSEISLVAVAGSDIVGHILFSRVTAPFPTLGMAPVSVLPARQRTGIGGRLINEGLGRAALDGCRGVFVLGDPAYYARYGFNAELASGFTSPYAGPFFQVRPLNGDLPARAGAVEFAPAFATLA